MLSSVSFDLQGTEMGDCFGILPKVIQVVTGKAETAA